MKIWLELTQDEGERLLEFLKGFPVDRVNTSVINAPSGCEHEKEEDKDKGTPENKSNAILEKDEGIKVTKEMIRAVLTEKKLQGKALKGLFAKFGATNLSGVREEDYPELLKDAEAV